MVDASYEGKIGVFKIAEKDGRLVGAGFADKKKAASGKVSPLLKKALREMDEYFKGSRTKFSVSLSPEGTAFQKKVWKALQAIPYGKTVSYKEIARRVGHPKAVRAVGTAVGSNPFCILIPCHRVVASDGSLGGYAFGLKKKEALLRLEKVSLPGAL